jgi:hypothetical protein
MAIGSPTELANGGSYTAGVGSDRIVLVVITAKGGNPPAAPTGMTLNGVSLTSIVYDVDNGGNTGKIHSGQFYLKESDIPSGSNTLAWTWGSTPGNFDRAIVFTLTGVNQTTSIGSTSSANEDSSTTIGSGSLTVSVDDLVLCHCTVASGPVTIIDPSGYDNDININSSTYDFNDQSVAHKIITSAGTESPAFTISSANGGVATFSVIKAAAGGGGGTFKPYWALNQSSIINSGIS